MKEKITELSEKLNVRPPLLILLIIVIIASLIYGGVQVKNSLFSGEDVPTNPPTSEQNIEGNSFIDKIKGLFSKEDVIVPSPPEEQLPSLPIISPESQTVDQSLINKVENIVSDRFKMKEIDTYGVGRRDPMRPITNEAEEIEGSGSYVGTYNPERIDDRPYDLQDNSKDYFGGLTFDDIVLDRIERKEGLLNANFIAAGSIYTNLKEGDYLAEIYYVEEINEKENTVTLRFIENTATYKAQNVFNK